MSHPLVSAMMITQASRFDRCLQAIADFEQQTYPNRELVIVTSDDPTKMDRLANHVGNRVGKSPGHVRLIQMDWDGKQQPLGAMRNVAMSQASGDYLVTWDDDDQHGEERIQSHFDVLRREGVAASALQAQCYLFESRKELWIVDWRPFTPPGIVMFRRHPSLRYPEVNRHEDSALSLQLRRLGKVAAVAGRPELYVRVIHDSNTSTEAHHLKLARIHGVSVEQWASLREKVQPVISQLSGRGFVRVYGKKGVMLS